MLKIQLDELEVFNAVVRADNFSHAANTLGITSSVVSRTIKKLEHKLAVSLFNRTTRKIQLTQEGQKLYQYSRHMLVQATEVEAYFENKHKAPLGDLVIDGATPFILHAISPLMPAFQQKYPGINVRLQSTESNIDLIHNKVDVAIRIGKLQDSSLKAKLLGHTVRKLYASPGYIQEYGQPRSGEDITNHNCLAFSAPKVLNTWPVLDANGQEISIVPGIQADSGETIKRLAVEGAGIACLSSFMVKQEVEKGELVPLLADKLVPQRMPIYAVFYGEKEVSLRLRCFLTYLSEHIDFA